MTTLAPPRPGLPGLSLGLLASLALHALAALALLQLTLPSPLPDQPRPTSELKIETEAVAQTTPPARKAEGERAPETSPVPEAAPQGLAPTTKARPVAPQTTLTAAEAPPTPLLAAAPPPTAVLTAKAAAPPPLSPVAPPAALAAVPPAPTALAATAPPATEAAAQPLPATSAPPVTPDIPPVAATLAWAGEGGTVDPVSLQAIASFMRPGETRADAVHDGLAGLLAAVPCARIQAEFDPATGALALRGHLPEEGLKAPLLAALQARIGPGIPVQDGLTLLPRPQCGALSGIADVGLPQSQDQLTNPRLIGADAQARTFTYGGGEAMVLDLSAPDYDAYVYVDYFDAGGNVVHLVPNERVPLELSPAKSVLKVGAKDGARPFLEITVGPPYGQEIAVAFAASRPLYDGVRPLSEPAEAYLGFLKERVAEARAADPGFKGEWVYFMVSTHP